jgi:hypothetical protein
MTLRKWGRMRMSVLGPLLIVTVGAASHVSAQQPKRQVPCLRFEPDTVRIAGVLRRHTYPGRPGFETIPAGDGPETGFYLHLARPICVHPRPGQDPGDDPTVEPRDSVWRVQLVLDSAGYERLRPYLGRRVTLRGTLFSAHTGHHHAPVLLTVACPVHVER